MAVPQLLSQISTRILIREPFYGHFFIGVPKSFTDTVETASVSLLNQKIIQLSVNTKFFSSLTEDQKYGLIKHELLHIVYKHLFKMDQYSIKSLYNIAADLVVNQYIEPSQLPEGAITLSNFWFTTQMYGISLEPNESTDYYYQQLINILQSKPNYSRTEFLEKYGEFIPLNQLMKDDNPCQKSHHAWREISKIDSAEIKVLEYQLHNHLKQVVEKVGHKMIGNLPGSLLEHIENLLAEYSPQVHWTTVLRQFSASSNSTFIKSTLRRPSKRYGSTPGIRVCRQRRLLVAIDTSGSVSKDMLATFFAELHQVWKQGAEVIITEFDTAIHNTYKYKGKTPETVSGRGGTDFTPPIILANQEIRPDGIIYFTDGFAYPPTEKSRCQILWVIASEEKDQQSPEWIGFPGKVVEIKS